MPNPGGTNALLLASLMLEQASSLSAQSVVEEPEGQPVGMTTEELVSAGRKTLLIIANAGIADAFLSLRHDAEQNKGIYMPKGGATRTLFVPEGVSVNAISTSAPTLLVWQAFTE